MHDPSTVAFQIKSIFKEKPSKWFSRGYRPTSITIWHEDPELDGTDDSCGYSTPKLSKSDLQLIDELADWDLKFPYFSSPSLAAMSVVVDPKYQYHQLPAGECLALVAAAWRIIARRRDNRDISLKEWDIIFNLATNPADNLRAVLARKENDRPKERVSHFFVCVMRAYLRHHRKWWQHPRWHLNHWRIQVHSIQDLQRWLFSRCAGCSKRFKWGYAPISTQWHSEGPAWFKGESAVWHHECEAARKVPQPTEAKGG